MDDDANVAEHAEQQPMDEVAPEEFAPEAEAVDDGGDGVDGVESADGRHGGEQEEEYPPEEAMHDGEDELYADAEPQEGTGDVHVGDEAPEGEVQDGDGESGNRRQQDEEYDTAADYANGEAAAPDAAPDAAVEAAGDDDAAAPPATRAKNEDNTPPRCMYVGNLSFKTDEITLAQECERYGQVRHVKLVKDKETGLPKGFAFVTFISPRGCEAACTGMRSRELDGRNLRVEAALGHKFDGNEKDGYFPPSQPEYRTQQLPPRLNASAGPREERANSRPEEAPRAGRGGSNGGGGDDAHSSSRPEARAERRSRDERLNGRDEPRGGGGGGGAAASARGDAPRDGPHHHRRGSGGGEEYAREAQRERGGGFARERSDARGDRGDRERAELTLRERERELERQTRAFEAAAAAAAAAAQAAHEEPTSRERSVYSGSFADIDRRERDRPAARSMPVYERGPPERHPSRGAYPPIREDSRERERSRYEAERMAAPLRRADSRDALRDDLYAPAHNVRRPTPLYVEGRDRGEVRYPEYEKPVALAPSDAPAYRGPPRGGYAERSPPRAYARTMHDDPSPPARYRASRRGVSRERDYSPPPQQRTAVAPAYEREMYAERERYAERDFAGSSRGGGGGGYAPERGGSGGGGGYERARFPPRAAAAPAPAPQPAVVRAATLPPSMIPSNADARTVFVGNIGTNITPEKLMTTFQRCGRIESVRIRSEKGFGFITFETKEAAKDAIRFFDKMELEGRTLKVAPPTPVRPGQPVVSDRPIIVPQRPVLPYGPERHMGGRMDRRAEYQRLY